MSNKARFLIAGLLFGLTAFTSGCIVETPREGYYDRYHHRYWHDRAWVACEERDVHCG